MKRKWKTLLLLFFAAVVIGGGYAYYIWNKPRPQVEAQKGIEITALSLFDSFTNNEATATANFVDKAMQVTGVVEDVKKNQAGETVIILKSNDPIFGINCTFKEDPGAIQKSSTITFKGFCKSFNSDVYITEGILVK